MSHVRSLEINPNPLVAGKSVTVTLEVEDPKAIASAKVYDPRGHILIFQPTQKDGQTVFVLTEPVPWDADPGTYYCTLVITDTEGNVERQSMEIRIA